MGKIITFGIQKGGCGKTTSCGIIAYLLMQEGYKVLAVDMDSQGNLTEFVTGEDIYAFQDRTVLEALQKGSGEGCIHPVNDKLNLMPANDLLATLPRWIYREYRGNPATLLRSVLESLRDQYDYILIDTPPALGDLTINALTASDGVVVMFEPSKFCFSAIPRFLETCEIVQNKVNPDLKITGILRTLTDVRRGDVKAYNELIAEEYPDLVYDTIINRKAATGRIAVDGLEENEEIKAAVEPYESFFKELISRV